MVSPPAGKKRRIRVSEKPVFDPSAAAQPGSGIFGLATSRKDAAVHVLPVPFEATTSYGGGAAKGPQAILDASSQIDLEDDHCGRPYEAGIFMLPQSAAIKRLNVTAKRAAQKVIASGGVVKGRGVLERAAETVNKAGAEVNALVRRAAQRSLDQGKFVGLVGGDHSSPYGLIAELSERCPGMGILQIDAHSDLRESYQDFDWSHASIMYNVATKLDGVAKLVQVAVRDSCAEEKQMITESDRRIVCYYDQELARAKFEGVSYASVAKSIVDNLPEEVYISFDIDGLDPKLCPNTGTPVPGGLDFNEAIYLFQAVVDSGRKIIGFDLCEVAPGRDDWDGNVGARLLYKLIGFALH